MKKTVNKTMRWMVWLVFFNFLFLGGLIAGCSKKEQSITLTVWHVYGGQTDSPLNVMIEEFNQTVGKEKGITLQVTQVSNTNTIHKAVLAASKNEPGAADLPDLFISYPKTLLAMSDSSVLVDFQDYFSEEELSSFVPAFLQEGMIDEELLVLPVAKSTEILFVNQTLFERFATETGADLEQLKTWEGLFQMSKEYRKWTDHQTPEVVGDGKSLFVHDYHFNYLQVGITSMGEDFFKEGTIAFDQNFTKAWLPYARAAIQGGIWLQDGYATEPLRTGEIIVSVASSASVLYYEDIVTYPNNISEPITVQAFPIPIFEDGSRLVMQRGAGFCLTKSTPEREKAASEFLKWLTEPKCNVRFVTQVGYMPVKKDAFTYLPEAVTSMKNPKYKSLYEAFIQTQQDYSFYTAPQLSNYLELEMEVEKNARKILREARENYAAEVASWKGLSAEEKESREEQLAQQLALESLASFQDMIEQFQE